MASLFEVEPNPDDPLDGIDLLYGIEDMSGGKAVSFFRELDITRSVDAQQAFARLASTIFYPHHIDAYCENMVLELELRTARRSEAAWHMAREEIEACIEYLDILAESTIVPVPMTITTKYEQKLAWNMLPLGKYQHYAGMFISRLEQYIRFCEDQGAIPDLQERLDFLIKNKADTLDSDDIDITS